MRKKVRELEEKCEILRKAGEVFRRRRAGEPLPVCRRPPAPLRREAALQHPRSCPFELLLLAADGCGPGRPGGGRRPSGHSDTGRVPGTGRHLRCPKDHRPEPEHQVRRRPHPPPVGGGKVCYLAPVIDLASRRLADRRPHARGPRDRCPGRGGPHPRQPRRIDHAHRPRSPVHEQSLRPSLQVSRGAAKHERGRIQRGQRAGRVARPCKGERADPTGARPDSTSSDGSTATTPDADTPASDNEYRSPSRTPSTNHAGNSRITRVQDAGSRPDRDAARTAYRQSSKPSSRKSFGYGLGTATFFQSAAR